MDNAGTHFDRIDRDGDGNITPDEFTALVAKLGLRRARSVHDHAFAAIDSNRDGRITRDEFLAWWARVDP